MAAKSRRKGQRNEQQLVNILREAGLEDACRVPLSGASAAHSGGKFSGDIIVKGKRLEAKIRKSGFATIYRWLGDYDGLVIRADRERALIVISFQDWIEFMKAAEDEADDSEGEAT
jgi:Holliday junction resolvase